MLNGKTRTASEFLWANQEPRCVKPLLGPSTNQIAYSSPPGVLFFKIKEKRCVASIYASLRQYIRHHGLEEH